MALGECDICGDEANVSRCKKHDLCDGGCGYTREDSQNNDKHLIHRIEGLWCDDCWKTKIDLRVKDFKGDTSYTSEIVCPYCGHKVMDSWEYNSRTHDDIDCSDCGKNFDFEVHMSVDYSSSKKEEEGEQ